LWHPIINPNIELNEAFYADQFAQQWFQDYEIQFAQPINDTTNESIRAMLAQADREGWSVDTMTNRLGTMFDQWIKGTLTAADFEWFDERMPVWRRELICRTESIKVANLSSVTLFKNWNVSEKEWASAHDSRVRSTHLAADGQVVGIDEPFLVGSSELMYPGDPNGPIGEIANCRCTVLPKL